MPESDVILEQYWTNVIQSLRLRTAKGADPDIRMRPRWAVLHLGGGDGSNSDGDIKWYDKEGNNVIHFSATETDDFDSDISAVGEYGWLRLGGSNSYGSLQIENSAGETLISMDSAGGAGSLNVSDRDGNGTVISSGRVDADSAVVDSVSVYDTLTAEHGVIKDLDLGGGNPDEDIYEPGKLNVWSDEGKNGVTIDGESGSIRYTGTSSQMSDARAKRSVEPIDDALDTVQRLKGVEYEWDDEGTIDLDLDDNRHMGFLAQEVKDVLPEAVTEDDAGYMGTADAAFTPVLVEAIKEQQSLIDEQQETIDEQKAQLDAQAARIEDQRDRISKLESQLADIESAVRDVER